MKTNFFKADRFNELIAPAQCVRVREYDLYVFKTAEAAMEFAVYLTGYPKRIIGDDSRVRSYTYKSEKLGGYVAELSVQFPGWGTERGVVLCTGRAVAGLALDNTTKVVLPIKEYTHTAITESGTLYVCFKDGTGFCRSKSEGLQPMAKVLQFAPSRTDAKKVYDNGGYLRMRQTPKVGDTPIYVTDNILVTGGGFQFGERSFRIGTRIEKTWTR